MIVQTALAILLAGSVGVTAPTPKQEPPGFDNGSQLDKLTPQQRADLAALLDAERRNAKGRTASERCYTEERKRIGDNPSALAQQAMDTKCREVGSALE